MSWATLKHLRALDVLDRLIREEEDSVDQRWADLAAAPLSKFPDPVGAAVDEFRLPVARITRKFSRTRTASTPAILTLIGDHQLGTCRMGEDKGTSVLDRWCRTHQSKNLYVVDTSCFPTGFGVNPMVTVVANALRVGTAIVDGKGVIPD